MSRVLWLLAAVALTTTVVVLDVVNGEGTREQRVLQRLVGGHMHNVQVHEELNTDDTGLLTASAGAGRESRQKSDDDEDKKTLSQQVADGKYGLIQKELFAKPPKRPGIVSYENNPEVPKDNSNNYGGLDKNEIWLAENHLLVLKGGTFPAHDTLRPELEASDWKPIDTYKAPPRQVKIPTNPKVPPPFPVQLQENGPIQILGTNFTRTLNGTLAASAFAIPPSEGYFPGNGPFFPPPYPYPANFTPGDAPFPLPPFPPGEYNPGGGPGPFPFPPPSINGTLPPYFASLPPGAMFLPPPSNQTDFDEDDPSIYYPPPYSFFYPTDNSTDVPPGPLVPGIILPPPPDFFAPLDKPSRRPVPTTAPPQTTTEPHRQIYPTTTPLPPTPEQQHLPVEINELRPITPPPVAIVPIRHRPQYINRTGTVVTIRPSKPYVKFTPVERRPTHRKRPQAVTILKPVVPSTTLTPATGYEQNEVTGRPFKDYGPPKTIISTTSVPLKAYYSTSNEIETNSVTVPPPPPPRYIARGGISTVPAPNLKPNAKPPTSYYYYEEEDDRNNAVTTPKPIQQVNYQQEQYYKIPKQYYVPSKQVNIDYNQGTRGNGGGGNAANQQPQYYYATARPGPVQYYTTSRPRYHQYVAQPTPKPKDTFSAHIARLQQQIQSFYITPKPQQAQQIYVAPQQQNVVQKLQKVQVQQVQQIQQQAGVPKPVYQYSFQAANYQQQHDQNTYRSPRVQDQQPQQQDKFRPLPRYSVQIQPAVEVTPPTYQKGTETPAPSKYYTTTRPDYEYEDVDTGNVDKPAQNAVTPPSRPIAQYKYEATPSPVYYTQQDDQFDDITKKYFTIFGQKLGPTTPLPPRVQQAVTARPRPVQSNKPIKSVGSSSLHGDTLVNYAKPRPTHNPNSEYISIVNQQSNYDITPAKYVQQSQFLQPQQQHQTSNRYQGGGGGGDVNHNYKQRQPNVQVNQNADIVRAISVPVTNSAGEGQPGSFISYQLPGDDGAHFYFLTPQLVKRTDQGVTGYFYAKAAAAPAPPPPQNNNGRIRRSRDDDEETNSDER